MKLRFANLFLVIWAFVFLFSVPGHAVTITDYQVIWQPDPGISYTDLSAKIEFTAGVGDYFAIILENTSGDLAPVNFLAAVALTGLGFNLPEGVSIHGGDASMTNWNPAVNPSTSEPDPDFIWGYNDACGPFANTPGILPVNTVISTLEATFPTTFQAPPGNIDGPDGGIFDPEEDAPNESWNYYDGPATFYIDFIGSGLIAEDVINFIAENDVVVSFGSPTAAAPEPATMLLLGSGLIGLVGFSRKFRKK